MKTPRFRITGYRGVLHNELRHALDAMGFDTDDVTLQVPLQAVWTALEDIDRRVSVSAYVQLELGGGL